MYSSCRTGRCQELQAEAEAAASKHQDVANQLAAQKEVAASTRTDLEIQVAEAAAAVEVSQGQLTKAQQALAAAEAKCAELQVSRSAAASAAAEQLTELNASESEHNQQLQNTVEELNSVRVELASVKEALAAAFACEHVTKTQATEAAAVAARLLDEQVAKANAAEAANLAKFQQQVLQLQQALAAAKARFLPAFTGCQ